MSKKKIKKGANNNWPKGETVKRAHVRKLYDDTQDFANRLADFANQAQHAEQYGLAGLFDNLTRMFEDLADGPGEGCKCSLSGILELMDRGE